MSRILIIYTGGTIGMMRDPKTDALRPFDFENITRQVPELSRFNFDLTVHSFSPLIDSSNMQPSNWVEIAEIIGKNYSKYNGFVILHGTDTMAYTASALSFMLENLDKPVILTGSQLPIGEIRTDAKENLITSLEIASQCNDDGIPVIKEVCIFFDYRLFRGNRCSKFSSAKFDGFHSPNYPSLAEAGVHISYHKESFLKETSNLFKLRSKIDPSVALLKIFPGLNLDIIKAILEIKNLKGLIIETYGSGNAPMAKEFVGALKTAIEKGIIILTVSQCPKGIVELGRYETSLAMKQIGVISGFDVTTEAAITKLMWLLGQKLKPEEVKHLLETSLRGEMTVN